MSTITTHQFVQLVSRFFFYVGASLTLFVIARMLVQDAEIQAGMVRSSFIGAAALVISVAILSFYLLYLGVKVWKEDSA